MNPQASQRARTLVIAIALIMTDASILLGDPDEMVFETPTIKPNAPAASAAANAKSMKQAIGTPSPQQSTTNAFPAGKVTLGPKNGANSIKPLPKPMPGTQPKSMTSTPPSLPANSVTPANNVTTANSVTSTNSAAPSSTGTVPKSATGSTVITASHIVPPQSVTRDGVDPLLVPPHGRRNPETLPMVTSPSMRGTPPPFRGALMGLNGETATERLLQMQSMRMELEQENELLRQQNAALQTRVKESHDQLMAAVREIQLARKEVTLARSDLDRLRSDLQSLREKVRLAEKEHSGFLQSMGPLLQQLLESNDVSALPPNPTE